MPRELAQLLVEEGLVGSDDVERALARQREAGGALDTALLELGLIQEDRLVALLSRASDLPAAPPSSYQGVDARARRVFPSKVAERHGLAPFALDGRELSLVAISPLDLGLLDEISFMLSLHLTPHVGPEWRVRSLIQRLYGGQLQARLARLGEAVLGPQQSGPGRGPSRTSAQGGPAAPAAQGHGLPQMVQRHGPPSTPPPGGAPLGQPDWTPSPGVPPREGAPAGPADLGPRAALRSPGFRGFGRVNGDASQPLAAALELAAEAYEVDWRDEPPAPGALPSAGAPGVTARPAGPASSAAPHRPLDRSAPPRWTLEKARATLARAETRDEVVVAALRYARDFFQFAGLFAVTRDAVAGHDALGQDDGARDICRTVAFYAADPGIFRTALDTRAPYLGPVARDVPGSLAVLDGLVRGAPRTALVYPILLRDRPICILYADNGEAPVSARRLGDLLLFLSTVGGAFERIIRARKAAPEAMTFGPVSLEQAPAPPGSWSVPLDLARSEAPTVEPAPGEPPPGPAAQLQPAEPGPAEAMAVPVETAPAASAAAESTPAGAAPVEVGPASVAPAMADAAPAQAVLAPLAPIAEAGELANLPDEALASFGPGSRLAPESPVPKGAPEPPVPSEVASAGSAGTPAGPGVAVDVRPARDPAAAVAPDSADRPEPSVTIDLDPSVVAGAQGAPPDQGRGAPAPTSAEASASPAPTTDEPSLEITLEKPLARRTSFDAPEDPAALVGAYMASQRGSDESAFLLTRLIDRAGEVASILCEQLPGPIDVDPAVQAQTPAGEQGLVFAAVAALGPAAIKPLLAMLSDPAPARRRAATVLLGQAGEAGAFGPLCERCFDQDASVADAARRALHRHRRDPALKPVPEKLRRALLSGLGDKASAAARAIGALRDLGSIPLLIQALDASDTATAGASAEALRAITLQHHGPVAREWLLWWKQNRGRSRADWLFGALTSGDRELRLQAAAELRDVADAPVAYSADLPDAERQEAARSWAAWFERGGHRV